MDQVNLWCETWDNCREIVRQTLGRGRDAEAGSTGYAWEPAPCDGAGDGEAQDADDGRDRPAFVSRAGKVAGLTETAVYAWCLMNNHGHILLRSAMPGLG